MRVTGFKLTYRLRELQDLREIVAGQFRDSVFQFQDERATKQSPQELMRIYTDAERKIAQLQAAQARYNLAVEVDVLGERMPLHQAVKLVGGAARTAKMWKDAAKNTGRNPYACGDVSRDKDHEYAQRMVSVQESLEHATASTRWASALRQAIQLGNAAEVEIEGLDPALFE
jgi:hypothetical protein